MLGSASAVSHRPRPHPAHAFLFSRDSDFLFSVWAWCGEGRVSPKGETGGIHSVVILMFVVLTMDSVLRNYFLGIWIFAKPRLILFLHFVRAEEGSGEESARASEFFGGRLWIK